MSSTGSSAPGIDRRALRTRLLLAQALMDLGAVQDVDRLEVGELAETAGVGRSTFYAHYASKDDFLIRSFVNMIAATETALAELDPDRPDLLPSRALFTHVHDAGDFARRIAKSDIYPRQMSAGEAKLREIVEANLKRLAPDWSAGRRSEAAIYVAGGFMGLLRWYMESGLRQTPDRMHEAFRRLSARALVDSQARV